LSTIWYALLAVVLDSYGGGAGVVVVATVRLEVNAVSTA
jgi:hypothetical protein